METTLPPATSPLIGSAAGRIPPPRRRWLTRVGLPAAIVLITAALLAFASEDFLRPAHPVTVIRAIARPGSPRTVQVATGPNVKPASEGAVIVQAPGWVEPDPFPVRIPALAEGTLREVLVLEGAAVKENQVVARMIDDEAKLAVKRAQAEVDRRQAAVDAAQTQWDHPVDHVKAVQTSKASVEEAGAELRETRSMESVERAKLAELEGHLKRLEQLPDGIIEKDRLERTGFQVQAQRASVEVLVARQSVIKARLARHEAEHQAAQRESELRITETQALADAKAMLAEAQTALAEAKLREQRMEIRAPASGVVMQLFAAPGRRMMLNADMPDAAIIAAIYDPKRLQVRADVPLGEAARIGVGQRAQIIVDVLPDRVFTGHITRLVHQADIGKNTLQVKVAIDDPVEQLKPEMLARVKFLATSTQEKQAEQPQDTRGASSAQSVFIPEPLIQRQGEEAFVWLVEAGSGLARRRPLSLGDMRVEGWIETQAGLNPGDALIVDPTGLNDGDRVRISGEVDQLPVITANAQRQGGGHGAH